MSDEQATFPLSLSERDYLELARASLLERLDAEWRKALERVRVQIRERCVLERDVKIALHRPTGDAIPVAFSIDAGHEH